MLKSILQRFSSSLLGELHISAQPHARRPILFPRSTDPDPTRSLAVKVEGLGFRVLGFKILGVKV